MYFRLGLTLSQPRAFGHLLICKQMYTMREVKVEALVRNWVSNSVHIHRSREEVKGKGACSSGNQTHLRRLHVQIPHTGHKAQEFSSVTALPTPDSTQCLRTACFLSWCHSAETDDYK